MTKESKDTGLSLLSRLDQYWVRRSMVKPAVLPNECILAVSPEHWIKYAFPSVLSVLLVAIGLFLFYLWALSPSNTFGSHLLFVSALILLSCVYHWFFWLLLAESQTCIIVTNRRVVYIRQGLLWNERMIEVSYEKMKTVEAHKKTLLQSIFNYGTLQFESKAKIHCVPHPGTLVRTIVQAMGMV